MSGFAEGYFIVFGGLALFGTVTAIYFYLQDRKESRARDVFLTNAGTPPMSQEPTNSDWLLNRSTSNKQPATMSPNSTKEDLTRLTEKVRCAG